LENGFVSRPETLTVRLRIICLNPPLEPCDGQPTVFGLQDKHGALQAGQPRADGSLEFAFDLQAKLAKNGATNFLGAYAHGTVDQRFVYLSLGFASDSAQGWIRRLKVPLSSIHWEQVERAHTNHHILEATVDGGRAGTVRLIGDSWITRS
jgi:hypothetical protein